VNAKICGLTNKQKLNNIKPKRKECALLESKTVKIQILRIENKGM
jgi:hypothetical protein